MTGYWWQCEDCGKQYDFHAACGSWSIYYFIWDVLLPSDWDQTKLTVPCSQCKRGLMRIKYDFPRKEKDTSFVTAIVGLRDDDYLPMMWETCSHSSEKERWFDFKYLTRGNTRGLNRPAVFRGEQLQKV